MLITLQVQYLFQKTKLERYTLNGERFLIGRSYQSHIRTLSEYCSRLQATIYEGENGEVYIKDLGGVNGTFLNRAQVKEALLKSGDEIIVGDIKVSIIHLLKTKKPSNRTPDGNLRNAPPVLAKSS